MVACRYAIVRFVPYPETGEFANVGIVLACPTKGYFNFKLQTRRYRRLTQFFRDLDANVYRRAIHAFSDELLRIQQLTFRNSTADTVRTQFQAITHPRDAILQFSPERPMLADDPSKALETLFARYVEHDFVTPEYREIQLERRVQQLINGLSLETPFRKGEIATEGFVVKFPLIQTINEQSKKVIKPFYLGHEEPNQIYTHGDKWVSALRRLKERDKLPKKVLFSVEGPGEDLIGLRTRAYEETCKNLEEFAQVITPYETEKIVNFARI